MSLNYGITCVNSDGDVIVSPSKLAALFAGTVTCSITSGTQTFDFPSVPAGALYAMQTTGSSKYAGGTHDWVVTSSAGHARIVFTFVDLPYRTSASTMLKLFASKTFEPDYGVNATNEAGERVISTILPASRFIQKLTLNPTVLGNNRDGWYCQTNSVASQDADLIFWSLPNDGTQWAGTTSVGAGSKVRMNLVDNTPLTGSLPEAFLFKSGPLVVSNTYGLRVFNGAGEVMFDAGVDMLNIESRVTGVDYNLSVDQSYSLPSGFTPAVYQVGYYRETQSGGCLDGVATLRMYRGFLRRSGTTLYARSLICGADPEGWDCRRDESSHAYEWGMRNDHFIPVINAQRYGGAVI